MSQAEWEIKNSQTNQTPVYKNMLVMFNFVDVLKAAYSGLKLIIN